MINKVLKSLIVLVILFSLVSTSVLADDDFGETLGGISYFLIIIIYFRTMLKIIVGGRVFGSGISFFKKRFQNITKWIVYVLNILNKTHAIVGVLAIIAVLMHCYFTGSFLDNFLLYLAIIVMVWHGSFGFLIKSKFCPRFLKNKYSFQAQFITGILVAVLAGIGHLLL